MNSHPLLVWGGIALALLAGIVSVAIWTAGQFNKLHDDITHLEQSLILAIDRHEEFVSGEHVDLLRNIATSQDDINFRLGQHWGWHQAQDEKLREGGLCDH